MNNTTENNNLIAEFMGLKYVFAHKQDVHGYTQTVEGYMYENNRIPTEDLKYHTAWDWIMPVVEKIEGLNSVDGVNWKYSIAILRNYCSITQKGKGAIVETSGGSSKIGSVYTAIIEFITWYNKNTA